MRKSALMALFLDALEYTSVLPNRHDFYANNSKIQNRRALNNYFEMLKA
jgi:2,4'-dihydroxyacetophenone dioxygenase